VSPGGPRAAAPDGGAPGVVGTVGTALGGGFGTDGGGEAESAGRLTVEVKAEPLSTARSTGSEPDGLAPVVGFVVGVVVGLVVGLVVGPVTPVVGLGVVSAGASATEVKTTARCIVSTAVRKFSRRK